MTDAEDRALPLDRDTLGRMVREAWVRWAKTQPAPKPSWLVPYDQLSEADKEADRQIGETVAKWMTIHRDAADALAEAEPVVVKTAFLLDEAATRSLRYPTIDEAKAAAQADYEDRIRSALVAPPAPAPAPGMRLVPEEPTEAMVDAAWGQMPPTMDDMGDSALREVIRAALAAAPQPAPERKHCVDPKQFTAGGEKQ